MQTLKKMSKGYDEFLEVLFYVPALMMAALLVVCALMVCLRKVLIGAFNWADEAMRFLMVYSTFLALPLLVQGKRNITIDLTDVLFSKKPKAARLFHLIAEILTLICCVALMPSIVAFMQINSTGTSISMQLPLWLVYSCLPIGFTLAMLASLNNIFKMLCKDKEEA